MLISSAYWWFEGWFFKHISQFHCTNKISNTIYPSAFDNIDIAKALLIMVKNFKSLLSKNNKKDRIKKNITQHLKEQCAVFWVMNTKQRSAQLLPLIVDLCQNHYQVRWKTAGRVTKFLTTDKNSTHCMFDQIHSVIYFCQL